MKTEDNEKARSQKRVRQARTASKVTVIIEFRVRSSHFKRRFMRSCRQSSAALKVVDVR